jgi:NitT/TauT family transport system substrate-binding protein
MKPGAKQSLLVALVVILAMVLVGTFFVFSKKKPQQERTLRLKWLANVGFVGDLYADTYGFFTEEGLNVKVIPGGPEHDAIRDLQTGEAHFGIASSDQVVKALAKGADVVVIAQIYQKNPVQWIYRRGQFEVNAPEDLKGKIVGITIGDNDENIMRALLKRSQLTEADLKLQPVQYSYVPFTTGEVQLFPVYRNTQGVELMKQLQSQNEQVGFFDPDRNGVRFVANSVVTTSKLLKDDREGVKRFLKALLRGWRESLNPTNQELATNAMLRYTQSTGNAGADTSLIREQIAVSRDLVIPSEGEKAIGKIDVNGWLMTEDIMVDQKLVERKVGIQNALDTKLIEEVITNK